MKIKRIFDIFFAINAILILGVVILICLLLSSVSTQTNGFFFQNRIGQFGKLFKIFKFRTIHPNTGEISKCSNFLRKHKLDELPQLFNVLIGDMSIVGPRPDVEGYYDQLIGENRKILELKPGLTSLASIKYFNEEKLLAKQDNPKEFNDSIIFPDKVKLNLNYYYDNSFFGDIIIIYKTLFRK